MGVSALTCCCRRWQPQQTHRFFHLFVRTKSINSACLLTFAHRCSCDTLAFHPPASSAADFAKSSASLLSARRIHSKIDASSKPQASGDSLDEWDARFDRLLEKKEGYAVGRGIKRLSFGLSWEWNRGREIDVDVQCLAVDASGRIIDACYYNNMNASKKWRAESQFIS
ncbi:unnamed protein product [Vitrella brassicaformis CCMP3155]|uniref:Uncharacterized protein n=1 Tax=Vitrella brassicaformis (strain CCMP3155) TaxID=1169540 RepID=A0A0G4F6S7_VITBC|nr:unnamed protein product [Vitrella brassicaformis CCMP3155]|eukprot:CEM08127.1 unnamed protein product [Vitrella brassicaformis CCMP3155]